MSVHEARKHRRLPAYLGAKIFFDNKPSTFDCLVKNFSDQGALIKIEAIWNLPETFSLNITKFNKSYECQTVWKTHHKLGVAYNSKF